MPRLNSLRVGDRVQISRPGSEYDGVTGTVLSIVKPHPAVAAWRNAHTVDVRPDPHPDGRLRDPWEACTPAELTRITIPETTNG